MHKNTLVHSFERPTNTISCNTNIYVLIILHFQMFKPSNFNMSNTHAFILVYVEMFVFMEEGGGNRQTFNTLKE